VGADANLAQRFLHQLSQSKFILRLEGVAPDTGITIHERKQFPPFIRLQLTQRTRVLRMLALQQNLKDLIIPSNFIKSFAYTCNNNA
jgi:hypothetical protein